MNRIINRSNAHQEGRICLTGNSITCNAISKNFPSESSVKNLNFNLMKVFFLFFLLISAGTFGQSVFTNPITGTNPSSSNPYTSGQTVNSNLTVSGIGYGSGMSANTGNDRYIVRGVNSSSLNSNDYFQFTISPKTCYEIDFVSLVYASQISSGSVNLALRSSIDNYAANIATSTNSSGATMSLAGAAFQNRTPSTTFRLYVWGASGSSTTFSINSFSFNGSVSMLSNILSLSSAANTNNQSIFQNQSIGNITYAATGATGATVSGLPTGVSSSFASNIVTISGTPSVTGTYNYIVTLTGTCASASTASGSICIQAISPTIAGIVPSSAGVTGQANATSYNGQTVTISGANFAANAQVSINGVSATSVTVVNANTITAKVANTGASSTGNLTVTNPSTGSSASTSFQFLGYLSNASNFVWGTASSWLGNSVPVNGSDVTIRHNGSMGTSESGSFNKIVVTSGSTLELGQSGSISVVDLVNNGTITCTSNGTLNISGQVSLSASSAFNPGNGTVAYTKNGNQDIFTGTASRISFNNLQLQGSGIKSVPAGADVSVANISIAAGVTFNSGTATSDISINGNISIDGSMAGGYSDFHFQGAADQTISVVGAGTAVMNGLRIAKTGGTVLLNSNVRILDSLIMISGNINTQGNILEIGSSVASKGVITHTSGYIHGKLRRWYAGTNSGTATGLFPMGQLKAGNVWENRIALLEYTTAPSVGGHLTVEFIPVSMNANVTGTQTSIDSSATGGTGFNISTFAEEGYWKIDNQAGTLTDGAYNIALSAENFTSIGTDISLLSMVKRVSMGNWFAPGVHIPASGDLTTVTLSRSGVSGFSNFGFGIGEPNVPLPVNIASMNVNCSGLYPSLNWTTVSEQDASHFVIQQSADGRSWSELGTTAASGNSDKTLRYSFSLENMSAVSQYVRLILQNKDASRQAFAPLAVCRKSLQKEAFTLYPNPTEGAFIIDLKNTIDGTMSVRVLNSMGVEVAQQLHNAARSNRVKMDLTGFATGIYQVLVGTDGEAPAQSFKVLVK